MEIKWKPLAFGLTASLFAATAFAKPPATQHDSASIDTDRNGQFSTAEITRAADQMFARADTNHDGRLSDAERRAAHGRKAGPNEGLVDAGGNGNVTLAEYRTHVAQHVGRADSNHDGHLSMQELNAMEHQGTPAGRR